LGQVVQRVMIINPFWFKYGDWKYSLNNDPMPRPPHRVLGNSFELLSLLRSNLYFGQIYSDQMVCNFLKNASPMLDQ